MFNKVVNLCPHDITVLDGDGNRVIFPKSGKVARVSTTPGAIASVKFEGASLTVAGATVYGEIDGLPAPEEGVALIVSLMVLDRATGRSDVFAPGTGPKDGAIRFADDHPMKGQIDAVTRLIAAPQA